MHRDLKMLTCAIAFASSIVGCDKSIVAPALPDTAVRITPLGVYAQWWAVTESCSGLTGSFAAVQWYEVPDNSLEIEGRRVDAYWSGADNRIVLTSSVLKDGQVVRHEMLHALLRQKGHSRDAFLEKCGGRVTCTLQCVEDSGPAPFPFGHQPLSPTGLEVTMQVVPTLPNSASNGGYFSITVSAHNAEPFPIIMSLYTIPNFNFPVAFSCALKGVFSEFRTVFALDPGLSWFVAGETKVHIFDFFVGHRDNPGEIFAGSYTATCGYGGHNAPDWIFTVI